jgi:DNA polymerase III subunit alpha
MTIEMGDTDKLRVLYGDALEMGITFEAPDVNRGVYRFEPVTDQSVRYGLGAIKGSGEQAIESMVAARNEGGPFTSLFDFCARVDKGRVNKRTVEALIKAGAFDSIELNRASLLASVERAFEYAAAQAANADQVGLFDMGDDAHGSSTQEPDMVQATPWSVKERLTLEKTAVGFFLSGHLFDEVATEVRRFAKLKIADLVDSRDSLVLAGIVTELRVISGQRGRLGLFKLDDKSGVIEAAADENLLNQHRNLLKDDEFIVVQAVAQPDRFSGGIRLKIQQVWSLADARCRFGKYLQVTVNGQSPNVRQLVKDFPARTEYTEAGDVTKGLRVRMRLLRDGAHCDLQLGEQARFFPTDAALASWAANAHEQQASVVYD